VVRGISVIRLGLVLCTGLGLGCYRDDIPEEQEVPDEYNSKELEEQRARLPDAAENCYDDVVGIWVGQSLLSSSWHHFTLDIDWADDDEEVIEGVIYTQVWTGTEEEYEPPECDQDSLRLYYTLEQPSEGSYEGGELTVAGQRKENEQLHCGTMGNYFVDTFTGTVYPGMNEFRVVNDDGFNPRSELLFRRIECDEKPAVFRTWPLSWVFD
jgi:hypothetical protein